MSVIVYKWNEGCFGDYNEKRQIMAFEEFAPRAEDELGALRYLGNTAHLASRLSLLSHVRRPNRV